MEWNEIIFPTSERRWISDPSLGDWLPVRTSLLWTSCNLSLVDSRAPSWTDRTTWRTLISLSFELLSLFSSLLLPCSLSKKNLSFTEWNLMRVSSYHFPGWVWRISLAVTFFPSRGENRISSDVLFCIVSIMCSFMDLRNVFCPSLTSIRLTSADARN